MVCIMIDRSRSFWKHLSKSFRVQKLDQGRDNKRMLQEQFLFLHSLTLPIPSFYYNQISCHQDMIEQDNPQRLILLILRLLGLQLAFYISEFGICAMLFSEIFYLPYNFLSVKFEMLNDYRCKMSDLFKKSNT
ncbi:unnamed protein product [Blepharisma stoltei]|uniref:Uncharacterized protein n=1 Tax=Blepharisma stoltei TaxID=1481888 RepID=A0AAU9KDW8_9CILI|nr:unnamed protein product [Blepharisma stoltei]